MNLKNLKYLFLLMMTVFMLSSCSEDDNSYDAYANWQQRNEQAFSDTLAYAKKMGESNGWYVFKNWSFENQTPNKDANGNEAQLTYKDCDYIVVHVLESGKGSGCPMYTDSVKVSYRGSLMETTDKDGSVNAGYVFDQNYQGNYNKSTAQLTSFAVGGVVDGLTTALLHMHIGDRWVVYMPYQLGYGTSGNSNGGIPGYSMLRFEVVLNSYYRPGQQVPVSRAVQSAADQGKGIWITQ